MGSETSAELPADRDALVDSILLATGHADSALGPEIRPRLAAFAERVSDEDLQHFIARMETTGGAWDYEEPDAVGREISHLVHSFILEPGSELLHAERLDIARSHPGILLVNHLAYDDCNVVEHLMCKAGYADLGERLTAIVGPKVFMTTLRRVASLSFGTIKIPQSQSRASEEALMSPREAALISRRTIEAAHSRLEKGDLLLIFVEGTRSRDGRMQRALAGVSRYLDTPNAVLIPVGLVGSDRIQQIGNELLHPARVTATVGEPIDAAVLLERCGRHRQLTMDVCGLLIAEVLPPEYRGFYGEQTGELAEARTIAATLRS
jgi:1-acyl-sn-glycerol-3-phosphate acyltransferase